MREENWNMLIRVIFFYMKQSIFNLTCLRKKRAWTIYFSFDLDDKLKILAYSLLVGVSLAYDVMWLLSEINSVYSKDNILSLKLIR